jgi:carboxypeptidase Q
MRTRCTRAVLVALLTVLVAGLSARQAGVDWPMVAKIREEGLQRSRVMDLESYMTDVLGARLTLSEDMLRAQEWALAEMGRVGLVNVAAEPYMDYGVAWDNEYVSLHMLEPDYAPMVAYPLAHTPGTDGRQVAPAMIADLQSKADITAMTGKLKGAVVLISPPVTVDQSPLVNGVPRRTDEELRKLEQAVIAPVRAPAPRAVPNPNAVAPAERMAFLKAEGVVAVLQCESGWIGAVRGFARPGANADRWSREATLASPPIVAVTPEHYNRLYRILKRGIPARIEIEVRNRIGERVKKAANLLGEIPGTDLKDEVVMIGAHFDTWHASPNASDNTSGVAVVLEAARILGRFASRSGAARNRASTARASTSTRISATPAIRKSARNPRTESSRRTSTRTTAPASTAASTCRATNRRDRCSRRGWRRLPTSA